MRECVCMHAWQCVFVSVCVCVCMWERVCVRVREYVYEHVYVFVSVCVCESVWMCVCVIVCICVYVWLCVFVCVCVSVYVWECVCECVCVSVYVWQCLFVSVCVYICVCIHQGKCTSRQCAFAELKQWLYRQWDSSEHASAHDNCIPWREQMLTSVTCILKQVEYQDIGQPHVCSQGCVCYQVCRPPWNLQPETCCVQVCPCVSYQMELWTCAITKTCMGPAPIHQVQVFDLLLSTRAGIFQYMCAWV
jgi:hypothetical protein